MIFATYIRGIACLCEVKSYTPGRPMLVTGSGFGDADPPEPEEFDFEILDLNEQPAPLLMRQVDAGVEQRLKDEYHVMKDGEYYEPE